MSNNQCIVLNCYNHHTQFLNVILDRANNALIIACKTIRHASVRQHQAVAHNDGLPTQNIDNLVKSKDLCDSLQSLP